MFCPKCGVETVTDARYCRTCGTDVSVVERALTGKLQATEAPVSAEKDPVGRLQKAVTSGVSGLGFLLVAACVLIYAPAGKLWWFWMLIPAFTMMGNAVAEVVRYRLTRNAGLPGVHRRMAIDTPSVRALDAPSVGDAFNAPPSVTESTTRHLEHPSPQRHE